MTNQKLKPCPFCGGAADFRIRNRGIPKMTVVCMKCKIELPNGPMSSDGFKCDKEYIEAAKRAAERWNNRTE